MDTLDLLMDGFGSVLTPQNLLYAAIGVLLGTFVGVLPGIGPAMAVALLLPVTYGLDPVPAFIMFAGIYYGGMYGGSTTAILLNTPGESASVMTALEGNLMAKRRTGRAGPRHRSHRLLHRRHDRHPAGGLLRPGAGVGRRRDRRPVVLRPDGARHRDGDQRAGRLPAAGLHRPVPRPHHRPGRARPQHRPDRGSASTSRCSRTRIDVVVVAVGDLRPRRGPVGRRAPAPQPAAGDPGRPALDGGARPQAVVGPVAARHGVRLPVRRAARRWRGDPDVPVLLHREAARRAPRRGRVRTRRHRGRRRAGGGQQRLGRRYVRPAAGARPPGRPRPRPSCSPPSRATASSRAPA